ncbi:MAG: prepilin-type N-terminal cleavage/methylation domain-containing protein [Desulfobacterales bacterium]|nr:MAG: prepilin-type N-terminal cleavage/methylation domain-containing protein [Desulfobacterales bacterium]
MDPSFFHKQKQDGGFTLLEILLAIFIFAIIVTTVFASYNAIFHDSGSIDQGLSSYEMAKNCLNRMIVDLESVYVVQYPKYTPPDVDDPPDPYRMVGDSTVIKTEEFPKLRFSSLAHLPLNGKIEKGVAEIVYYVQDSNVNGFVLRRADTLYPDQPFAERTSDPILCEGLKSLTFTYYGPDGEAYDFWDSDAKDWEYATPKRIKIKLELANHSDSMVFETMVTLPVYRKMQEDK